MCLWDRHKLAKELMTGHNRSRVVEALSALAEKLDWEDILKNTKLEVAQTSFTTYHTKKSAKIFNTEK